MERISIQLRAVTASFVHAEPDGPALWRGSSFRGMMRWWYRALIGAAYPPSDVRGREALLFGSTIGPAPCQSRVTLRVPIWQESSWECTINPKAGIKPYKRKAFKVGAQVIVEILPTASGDARAVRQAYAAFWTAIQLGGIGQRSRRGAGSLAIVGAKGNDGLPGVLDATEVDDLARQLESGLASVRKELGIAGYRQILGLPEYPVLHPGHASVTVCSLPVGGSEDEVRQKIMEIRRKYHRGLDNEGEYEFGAIKPQRLSSPLWIRVAQITESRSICVRTLLKHRKAETMGAQWKNVENMLSDAEWGTVCEVKI